MQEERALVIIWPGICRKVDELEHTNKNPWLQGQRTLGLLGS